MFFSAKKFDKEIQALKRLPVNGGLLPLQKEQIKQRVLARLAAETVSTPQRYTRLERKNTIMRYIISTLLGLSLLGGTAFAASGNAKPGDILFPVKKAGEHIQVSLTPSMEAKARLQAKFAEERLRELNELSAGAGATSTAAVIGGKGREAKTEAKIEAEGEVSNAITSLQEVKTKLEAKGNLNAAAAINRTLIRLENKSSDDRDENRAAATASGTAQTRIEIRGEQGTDKIENRDDEDGIKLNGKIRHELEIK